MKRLLLLGILLLGFGVTTSFAQDAQKRTLVEDFTGTWCGWCPRGIWAAEQLDSNYGDKVVYISWHYGDPMELPTSVWDSIGGGKYGFSPVNGFPDGWVERRSYDGKTLDQDPTGPWDSDAQTVMGELPDATVTVTDVKFDPGTRIVTGTVNVKFLVDTVGDIRFNMILVEDSVSGPAGSKYDQHNYLTNRAGYEDNPYYKLPAVVPGVQHRDVVRAVLGGIDGVAGVIPATVKANSTYSATFSYTIPALTRANQCKLVGFAEYFNGDGDVTNVEVLNVDEQAVTKLPSIGGITISAKN
jgi:hypothetical protein